MKIRLILIIFLISISGGLASAGLFELIEEHFTLHKSSWTHSELNYFTQNKEGSAWDLRFLFEQAEEFLRVDVPQSLQSHERARFLSNYLEDGDSLLLALTYQANIFTITKTELFSKRNDCLNTLEKANTDYRTALDSNNELLFERAISHATQARECLAKQHVDIAVLDALENKRASYTRHIEARTAYLKKNQQLIVQHYDILDPQLLSELYYVSRSLEASRL